MKNIIPFTKEIKFDNKISEITSISLENTYTATEDTIDGEFIISGDYTTHELSVNRQNFEYKLPFSVDITEKIVQDKLNFEIVDFSYDILNDDILKVNIEFEFEAPAMEEREEIITNVEELLNEPIIEDFIESDEVVEIIEDRIDEKEQNNIIKTIQTTDDEYISYHIHIIKESETIESICALYNVNQNLINEYNKDTEFKTGEKLIIVNEDE